MDMFGENANPLALAGSAAAAASVVDAAQLGEGVEPAEVDADEIVTLPDGFTRTRQWLCADDGSPTALARAGRPLALAAIVIGVLYVDKMVNLSDVANLSQVDMLRVISVVGVPVALLLLSGTVTQLQLVLRPTVGGLALLGVEPGQGVRVSRTTEGHLQAMTRKTAWLQAIVTVDTQILPSSEVRAIRHAAATHRFCLLQR
eukprot:COSAG02_NODE_12880_length_1477_cov_2.973149_1_plen_202_part_00